MVQRLLTLLVASWICNVHSDDAHVALAPISKDASLPEKMLVFIPGGKVPNTKYIETAKAIQTSASHVRLWVVIPGVFQRLCIISCSATSICAPLHYAVESALELAKKQGWKRTKDDEDMWLAGHSLGGICANTLFQAYATSSSVPYAGLIVMGSYVDETGAHDLTNYPKPVFTLNVELDGGLARPGKTSVWWRQHLSINQSQGETKAVANKPVIILPKLNHSDFCPGFDVAGDLMAEVDQATATNTVGQAVAAFLHIQTAGVSASVKVGAMSLLRQAVAWTSQFMAPYLKAQAMERTASDMSVSAEGSSPFCAHAQHIIAGLSEKDDERLTVTDGFHTSSPNLEHCHPNWTVTEDKIATHSCSHTDYYTDIQNTGSITAASEIACKMLSSDRVAQQLKITAENPKVDCREVNKYAVQIAESIAAPSTIARYKAKGRGWCYLDDVATFGSIGPAWVFHDAVHLKDNATCMTVSSPVLKTTLTSAIYPGNHYCKFLSPARVLDWMMTDSIKPGKSVQSSSEIFI